MIKFKKHYVTNGTTKARVWYSLDNHVSGQPCVTMYEKDYAGNLSEVFPTVAKNDSDIMRDYHAKDRVRLFADHPMYAEARAHVEAIQSAKGK
jgi:hypothetical protein